MTMEELAEEYLSQYNALKDIIKTLEPLLQIYQGTRLLDLRKTLKTYNEMALDCMWTYNTLKNYYKED